MTEDEAKTKACCSGIYRPVDNGPCIASDCMAWRWVVLTEYQPLNYATSMQSPIPKTTKTVHGYCGLAGRPEDRP